jgi:hypothetical protein
VKQNSIDLKIPLIIESFSSHSTDFEMQRIPENNQIESIETHLMATFDDLPIELYSFIFSYLNIVDLPNCRLVSFLLSVND